MTATATASIVDRRTAVIEVGIDIDRPPESVFDYCSDHTNEIEWNPEMRRVAKLTEGPIGVGTRYEMEFIPGHPMIGECVQFDRPSLWAVAGVAYGMQSSFSGRVDPIPRGSHLALRMELEAHGLLRALLPLLRRRMPRNLKRDIASIKATLEERGGPRSRRERAEMITIKDAADDFLAHKRIAVTGVSRNPKGHGSNAVYQRLRQRGYEVFAVNPNATEVEGDISYHDLASIPGGVEAVVIGTTPEIGEQTMRECAELGIKHVWMHRSFGKGSVSDAATEFGRTHGISVIDGGCPLMFDPTADGAHKAMRFVFTMTGKVPRRCEAESWSA